MGSDYFESIEEIKANIDQGIPHLGIGPNSAVRRAIVDKNVRIGKDVRLLNEGGIDNADGENGAYYIREGIIIVPKGGVIPDGTVV
jgi:glucose-1-phosphate adenylyltransferase